MADENQPEHETGFQHQISRRQYLEGLKAEYRAATTKEHKAAVKAEIDALVAETAVQGEKEQA